MVLVVVLVGVFRLLLAGAAELGLPRLVRVAALLVLLPCPCCCCACCELHSAKALPWRPPGVLGDTVWMRLCRVSLSFL